MLEKFTESLMPSRTTHVWIYNSDDNEFLVEESPRHSKIHAECFGEWAWEEDIRGYIYENEGVVSCHGPIPRKLLNKLERFLDENEICVCYFKGYIRSGEY